MDKPFKICTICTHHWENLIDLIRDNNLYINGYQASFDDSMQGLFLFTHDVEECGTTFAITAGSLLDLYDGPAYTVHMALTERCDGHCLRQDDFDPCYNECDMRWARDILQILKNHGPEESLLKLAS